jgi:hypothetical protein
VNTILVKRSGSFSRNNVWPCDVKRVFRSWEFIRIMFDPNTIIQKTPGGTGAELEYVWLKKIWMKVLGV